MAVDARDAFRQPDPFTANVRGLGAVANGNRGTVRRRLQTIAVPAIRTLRRGRRR